jgi:hypothetical protein
MGWWDEQTDQRRTAIMAGLNSERGQRCLEYSGGSQGFAGWLLVADVTCVRTVGVSIFDLSDWTWRDAYDAGTQPGAAVRDAVQGDDTVAALLGGP